MVRAWPNRVRVRARVRVRVRARVKVRVRARVTVRFRVRMVGAWPLLSMSVQPLEILLSFLGNFRNWFVPLRFEDRGVSPTDMTHDDHSHHLCAPQA